MRYYILGSYDFSIRIRVKKMDSPTDFSFGKGAAGCQRSKADQEGKGDSELQKMTIDIFISCNMEDNLKRMFTMKGILYDTRICE